MIKICNNYLRDIDQHLLSHSNAKMIGMVKPQPGKCNYFSMRHNNGKPLYIVQHHTDVNFDQTIKIFTSNDIPVSTHYVIDTDGSIYKLVDPHYLACHAGVGNISTRSKWYQKDLPIEGIANDMNNWSIGIENVNSGVEEFTDAQKNANVLLCEYLCNEYKIDPQMIIGHADWSPGRKIDPSPYFSWESLSRAYDLYSKEEVTKNFGIYPQQNNVTLKSESDILLSYNCNNTDTEQVAEIQNKLKNLYVIDDEDGIFGSSTRNALLSFRIHFSGSDIIDSLDQRLAWEKLFSDNNMNNRNPLGIFTENDLKRLDDILDIK